ncbi:MAG TPA: membrane protein insertase YidC [Candidatus Eisenbacteria bacterium]|nr:membrane protein insertase YidC [Candidatus Eisenbacteria bacterium]
MEKRMFVAVALSFLVIGLYPVVLEKMYPGYARRAEMSRAARSAQVRKVSEPETATPTMGDAQSDAGTFLPSQDIRMDNGKVSLTFNQKGGAIREIDFPRFTDPQTRAPLRIFSLNELSGAPFSTGIWSRGGPVSPESAWKVEDKTEQRLVLASSAMDGRLSVRKTFSLPRGSYSGTFTIAFENTSAEPLEFNYSLFAGNSFPARNNIDQQYIEANFYSSAAKPPLRHVNEKGAGKTVRSNGPVDWIAVKDRQFSLILKPKENAGFTGFVAGLGHRSFRASLASPAVSLSPGASVSHEFLVYMGPNDIDLLAPMGLDPLINFGKLDWIGKLLVGGLELLHKVFRNYGLAIIALTFLINLCLFPFTRASYMSMKRMQLIQPQMNKLKEVHKKNPEKLNREMMELYKKNKVNPFGGCLPMVIQMPVFMALYVALSKSVILMNSQFLWIRDLSSPDKVQLPFSLPFLGNEVHVLPLIMVGAMTIQQRFTQVKMEGQDPALEAQQKMMAVTMPVIFGFIFYTMPSGLVLYWLTNTLLMTLYQYRLKKVTL